MRWFIKKVMSQINVHASKYNDLLQKSFKVQGFFKKLFSFLLVSI
jgi:hypothetical protein